MTALAEVCDARGTGLTLVSARNQQKLSWNIQSALVDGFVLLCVEGGERLVELTRERQLPFISLALGSDDQSIPAIGVNNIDGAATAARHLTGLGHRRFAVLATEFTDDHVGRVSVQDVERGIYSTSRDRAAGYWHALAETGISREEVPVFETQNDRQSVHACLEQIFASAAPPTAILAMSDNIAILAMAWLAGRGLNVPDDISIVGFDGVPEGGLFKPGLTTMAQPFEELAIRAVSAILDDTMPMEQDILDVKLAVRGSTVAPKI